MGSLALPCGAAHGPAACPCQEREAGLLIQRPPLTRFLARRGPIALAPADATGLQHNLLSAPLGTGVDATHLTVSVAVSLAPKGFQTLQHGTTYPQVSSSSGDRHPQFP